MINTIIKDYHIHSELGRGGMATVYLAHDNKFDTNVAVKVLNKEFVNNENIRKRFIAEARNMFKMSHPNIIKVSDLIDEGDTVAFVMEYIDGETLKEYLDRKGKLSDEEIKNLFSQMLDAVGYVHEQNLVHRDIKPSNFMLDKKGKIKLMDFGIAKNMDVTSSDYTQTGTTQSMGTPMYMSPEQIKSTKDVTLQSDIYSLGVVLWQMVMGKKPYDTNTTSTFELQTKIVNDNLPSTSSFFDYIVQKATQKNPSDRYVDAQSFQVAIKDSTYDNDPESTIVEKKTKRVDETVLEQSKESLNINDFGHELKTFSDANIRAVKIPGKDYYMGETQVTIGQYLQFCKAVGKHYPEWLEEGSKYNIYKGTNDSYKSIGMTESNTNHPITGVSWHDAVAFANWAGGRLPTEEEWESAAKGGQNFTYAGSDNINDVAWYAGNSENKTHPVKTKIANGYGLYDMSGNVWEWTNTTSGSSSVLRGGGWYRDAESCRLDGRSYDFPDGRYNFNGFRVLFPWDKKLLC